MKEFDTKIGHGGEVFIKDGLKLTKKETDILKLLLERKDKIVFKKEIIEKIWGKTYPVDKYSLGIISAHLTPIRSFLNETESKYEIYSLQGQDKRNKGLMLIENV